MCILFYLFIFFFLFFFFAFYAKIPDGREKWRENNFWENSSVDPADALRVKDFIEITHLALFPRQMDFLRFTQKFRMAAKNGGKIIFGKSCQ